MLLVMSLLSACSSEVDTKREKPANVPPTAVWVGGADGGVYIDARYAGPGQSAASLPFITRMGMSGTKAPIPCLKSSCAMPAAGTAPPCTSRMGNPCSWQSNGCYQSTNSEALLVES